MRPLRATALFLAGVYAGLAGAAALLKRMLPSRGDAESDEVALVAIFDGVRLKSRATAFRGGSALAWFGGIAVDLREAELAPEARLSVHALLGGIAIRIPDGWRVESSVQALGGGVDVTSSGEDAGGPTLTLDGLALLGGISVGPRAKDSSFES